jgi:cytochrome c
MKRNEKALKGLILSGVMLALMFSSAAAQDVEKGKALFNTQGFAGGKKACSACHPGGKGLEQAGAKGSFGIMGGRQGSLEEAVNFCIVNASKGKAIPEDSQEMKDIVAYIRALGGGTAPGHGGPPR